MAVLDSQQGAPAQIEMLDLRWLREAINGNFSQMDEQADAVQFETGPTRNRNLRKRDRMLAVQTAIRTSFCGRSRWCSTCPDALRASAIDLWSTFRRPSRRCSPR